MSVDLVELLGKSAALTLAARFGGRTIHVPRRVNRQHRLTLLLGDEAAAALVKRHGGARLYVPRRVATASRNEHIRQFHRGGAGESVRSLASRYRLSERQVWKILELA